MKEACFYCDVQQMKKICHILNLEQEIEEKLITIVEEYLHTCDMKKTNPEIMAEIWQKIMPVLKTDNPYKEMKSDYNQLLLTMENTIYTSITTSSEPLQMALKIAITGNLIDFAAKHTFTEKSVMDRINNVKNIDLIIDDSKQLFATLKRAKSLLYLGDNCGEIVLDKLFIRLLVKKYPTVNIYYGVRGKAIVNDVTMDDAIEVKMDEVATVISNGDGALKTVLNNTSEAFKEVFEQVDLVICKGQGNYEGLVETDKENIFFLFMAKCELVANLIGVDIMSTVCMKNRRGKWY